MPASREEVVEYIRSWDDVEGWRTIEDSMAAGSSQWEQFGEMVLALREGEGEGFLDKDGVPL